MALFKIMRGDSSRISTDVTAFHDGYAYFTPDDGGFYIDAEYNGEQKRYRIKRNSACLWVVCRSANNRSPRGIS